MIIHSMHRIAQLQVLVSTSHSFNPTCSQPASCRMTTSLHVPKNINQYTLETSYSALYRLRKSNEFILACKGSNNFNHNRLSNSPTHVVAHPFRVARVLSKFGGIHIFGRANPKTTSDLRRCPSYSSRQI